MNGHAGLFNLAATEPLETQRPDRGNLIATPDIPNDPLSPISEPSTSNIEVSNGQTWSSAVGRANLGKSGRVIERLMADNDRLVRELKVETMRREEETKRNEATRQRIEGLERTNEMLLHQVSVSEAVVGRRERRIEELKLDLDSARKRADHLEEQLRAAIRDREVSSCLGLQMCLQMCGWRQHYPRAATLLNSA
jgi:hypothetical protein